MKKLLKTKWRETFSERTRKLILFDILRLKARRVSRHPKQFSQTNLHLGCGNRKIEGWLNLDVIGSDLILTWPVDAFR
ncbi:MAG: hypothetical protein HC880_07065 [Bacteroidia bacterium]|nr:hypothetical protein [Bacteroidia bacterium]